MRLYRPENSDSRAAAALRWGSAGLLVVALHAGLGWWVARSLVPATPPATVKGIPIDLEPIATPTVASEPTPTTGGGPAPSPQAAAPSPQAAAAPPIEPTPRPAPETPPEATPTPPEATAAAEPPPSEPPPAEPSKPVEPPPTTRPPAPQPPPAQEQPPPEPPAPVPEPQPAPEPPPAAVPPQPTAQPTPEPPPVTPPEKDTKSDAVLAPPLPKRPPPPDPKVMAREAARRKAESEKRAAQRAARAEARAQAQAAARATRAAEVRDAGGPGPTEAAPSAASSGASVATWRGAVQAHLRAFTPSGSGASGTARVSFSVDRSGRVVSASLAGSSGDPGLDSAAVAMVRRASPVPAPPPELGSRVSLSVPVHFQ